MATAGPKGPGSVTTASDRLEDQAASAALYVTSHSSSSQPSHSVLDEDGKLSSAGAATSLKYARAQDLPSFPSQGGVKLASAGAAATLAEHNQKPFEHWKPAALPAANKAALQAKDYKMDPLWKPELSTAGSKAAVLAHRDTSAPEAYVPPPNDQSPPAAGHALSVRSSTPQSNPRELASSDHRKALLAATGAMSGGRRRADSAPMKPQTPNQHAGWALKAATSSHHSSTPPTEFTSGDPGFEAARIQNVAKSNVSRQMYGSTPPVSIEVQEKNRQDMLRASAVAMAQKMYALQQRHIDDAKGSNRPDSHIGARAARNRALSDASNSVTSESPARYENLEEAARKLAQERLAKLHDEHAEYRQYYGQTSSTQRKKLTLRGRRRASSLGDGDDSDEEQSRKIRTQMSIFQNKLAEVDGKKRQADRDALLERAHKNVTAQLNKMDEKVLQETGKASPQQRELWERQARERAQRDSDERMINVGKVNIGGGKYLDQSEVDAIAKARLQPTLDEITDMAEKQRAKDEEIRLDQERQKQQAETEKARQAEIQREVKEVKEKEKQEERTRQAEERRIQKEEATAEKEKRRTEAAAEKEKRQAEAAVGKERARQEKEEKRKSKEDKPGRFSAMMGTTTAAVTGAVAGAGAAAGSAANKLRPGTSDTDRPATSESDRQFPLSGAPIEFEESPAASAESPEAMGAKSPQSPQSPQAERPAESRPADASTEDTPASPTKGDSKVKSWFKTHFRSSSKAQADVEDKEGLPGTTAEEPTVKSSSEEDKPRSDSMRDVAMAGRKTSREKDETEDMYGGGNEAPVSPVKDVPGPGPAAAERSPSISSVSSYGDEAPKASLDQGPSDKGEAESESRGRRGFRNRLMKKMGSVRKNRGKSDAQNVSFSHGPGRTVGQGEEHPPANAPQESVDKTVSGDTNKDDVEEARDTFEEEKLAPPPTLPATSTSSPRGSRERSRFTEDL